MTTENLTTTSPVLANIAARIQAQVNPPFTMQAFVDRINQSPSLKIALNAYQENYVIQLLPIESINPHKYQASVRLLELNNSAFESPMYLVKALAHEIYGHDVNRQQIINVLDPANAIYQGKTQDEVKALVTSRPCEIHFSKSCRCRLWGKP